MVLPKLFRISIQICFLMMCLFNYFLQGYDDTVIENAQVWVMEDAMKSSESIWNDSMEIIEPTDSEMLRAYATGILYTSLTA